MINVVIPMAGIGSRFSSAGYKNPKPFIDVNGKPMIQWVLDNLQAKNANYILIAQNAHLRSETKFINSLKDKYGVSIVGLDGVTDGTACTVLHAAGLVNNDMPLVIANSDQYVNFNFEDFLEDARLRDLDGSILTFLDSSRNHKWSFAKIEDNGYVSEVKEKQAISDIATVGIYYFRKGREFVNSTVEMILNKDVVNGEYYTCPVYNYLIKGGGRVGIYSIKEADMHGLGTPEDLDRFIQLMKS